jgi:hypothetical protein
MDEFESGGAPEEAEKDLEAEQAEVAVEASEAEDAVGSELPSLPNRVLNVFLSPGKLMDAIAQTPAVAGALGTAAFLIAVSTLLIPAEMMAETMRQAALDAGDDPGFCGPAALSFVEALYRSYSGRLRGCRAAAAV